MPEARRFQESRMPGNPLVRFDEGRVGRTQVSPSLLLYRLNMSYFFASSAFEAHAVKSGMLESEYVLLATPLRAPLAGRLSRAWRRAGTHPKCRSEEHTSELQSRQYLV